MSKSTESARKRRAMLIALFGGCCTNCGSTNRLEFAHIRETGLSGMGRGRDQRLADINKNRDCYALLCRDCHSVLDERTPDGVRPI